MLVPPVLLGATKLTLTWVSPAVATDEVGAPATTALTVNVRLTGVAARYALLPAWLARMVQLPVAMNASTPSEVTVQTAVVEEVKVTSRPEVAEAPPLTSRRSGVEPKFCEPGLAKVMICGPAGATALLGTDATLVPAELVAVTEKV